MIWNNQLAVRAARAGVAGDVVECGVYLGSSAGVLGCALVFAGSSARLWLFDSWAGLPPASPTDVTWYGATFATGTLAASREAAQELLFERLRLPRARCELVAGWFSETLPATAGQIPKIAILHLDGDYYESTRTALELLFPRVVPGGWVVIDDYGYFGGCRRAVDEYLARRRPVVDVLRTDRFGLALRVRACDGADSAHP